jgi:hypothetical protein
MFHPRSTPSNTGTIAVITFIAGACILVLTIILILLWVKKRRAARKPSARTAGVGSGIGERGLGGMVGGGRGGRYGRLEDDEEGAWSVEMESEGSGKGGYAPVSSLLFSLMLLICCALLCRGAVVYETFLASQFLLFCVLQG